MVSRFTFVSGPFSSDINQKGQGPCKHWSEARGGGEESIWAIQSVPNSEKQTKHEFIGEDWIIGSGGREMGGQRVFSKRVDWFGGITMGENFKSLFFSWGLFLTWTIKRSGRFKNVLTRLVKRKNREGRSFKGCCCLFAFLINRMPGRAPK